MRPPLLKSFIFVIILFSSLTITPNLIFANEILNLSVNPRYIKADGVSTSILTADIDIAYGAPVGGYWVHFWIDQGTGTISPEYVQTNSSGIATTTYRSSTTPGEVLLKAEATVQIPPDRGGGTRRVWGMVKVWLVKVEVKQDGGYITDTRHNEIVGKKINLNSEVKPPGLTITSRQWNIPGQKIKDYSATTTATTLIQFAVGDLTNANVSYYWVDGGDGRQVEHSIVIAGVTISGKATFDVKKPTSTMTATTGTVAVDSSWGYLGLYYGSPTAPGISFSQTTTVPSGFTGETQYWQVVTNTTSRRKLNSGTWQRLSGSNLLDTTLPYDSGDTTNDSPGLGLSNDYTEVTVNDDFRMWLMFKPSGVDSIWVPLRSVTWSWSGRTTRSDSNWSLVDSSNTVNPSSVETIVFPTWTGNVTGLTWTNE